MIYMFGKSEKEIIELGNQEEIVELEIKNDYLKELFENRTEIKGGHEMLKVWKLEYFLNGRLVRTVVLANNAKEAIDTVIDGEDVIEIEKCEQIREKGKVLTWYLIS